MDSPLGKTAAKIPCPAAAHLSGSILCLPRSAWGRGQLEFDLKSLQPEFDHPHWTTSFRVLSLSTPSLDSSGASNEEVGHGKTQPVGHGSEELRRKPSWRVRVLFFFFWFAVCFVFTRKDRAWEEESKMSRVVHLGQGCRWPQSHRSFPKGLKMPWVFLLPDLAP